MEDLKEFLWQRVEDMIEKEKKNYWYLVNIHRYPGVRYARKKSAQKLEALYAAIQILKVLEEDEIPVRVSVEAHSSVKSGALDETIPTPTPTTSKSKYMLFLGKSKLRSLMRSFRAVALRPIFGIRYTNVLLKSEF